MKQIYTNTTEKIYLKVFKDGQPYSADSAPTYTISIVGSAATPRTGTSVAESTGVYYLLAEIDETEAEGVLKVDWNYVVDTQVGAKTDYVTVVTPYAAFFDVKELAPAGTTDKEIENAETFARYMINSYTGQSFGKRNDSLKMHGNDQSVLVLPHRIIRLDSIAVNDEVLWTRSPAVNDFGKQVEITDTNYGLLATKIDNTPIWAEEPNFPAWKKNNWYTFTGVFGWDQVPDEVEYSARLLSDDYFCKETAWKKRFVEQINASDWRVVFNQKQFQGTGNYFADQILARYKSIGMVII